MKIRRDDMVMIVAGKDKGKTGKVRFAYPRKEQLIVEGINFTKKHARAVRGMRQAGIVERESPIHVSSVMLMCNRCNRPARVGFRFLEDGRKVRICRACHEVID